MSFQLIATYTQDLKRNMSTIVISWCLWLWCCAAIVNELVWRKIFHICISIVSKSIQSPVWAMSSIFWDFVQHLYTHATHMQHREIMVFIGKTKRKIKDDLQCNESFKRILKRVSIRVCGLYIHLCVVDLWSRCDTCANCGWPCLWRPLRMCLVQVCSESVSMSL